MRMLIRIVFVIFIANGIDCLGKVCDNCCDCFKDKNENENEKIEEYEEIEEEGNITAKSLVNDNWYKYKEKNLVLKIFKKKDDNDIQDNGDKILIKLKGNNNPKIAYQNKKKDPLNLKGKKYALFEIKTQEEGMVYLYCSDVESLFFNGIFEGTTHVSISVIACDTEKVTDMSCMFSVCNNLKELNLQKFNTTNVTNMQSMFNECSSLKELDLKNFNTTEVTNMPWMFRGCSSLKNLDISNFNTSKVTDMTYMFAECSTLKNLYISNFNASNIKNKGTIFYKCENLPKETQNKILGINE